MRGEKSRHAAGAGRREKEEIMAIREVREIGDDILTKKCKDVPKMTLRTKILIGDMLETMYDKCGVGLAAPQVGVLKKIVVIDVGEGPIVLINPEIIETSGEQTGEEGCLNQEMEPFEMEGEGLLARAFCHEIDHLYGQLYVEKAEDGLHDVTYEQDEEEETEE